MSKESPIAIFTTMEESEYFPEITSDPSSTYMSPLMAITQDIRRKNVAGAVNSTGPQNLLLDDKSDPWDISYINNMQYFHPSQQQPQRFQSECTCVFPPLSPSRASRTHVDASQKNKKASSPSTTTDDVPVVCPTCGKKRLPSSGFAWTGQAKRSRSASISLDRMTAAADYLLQNDEPQHAQASLNSTPQLRVLSPASTDMQGAGQVLSRNFLHSLVSGASGGDHNISNLGGSSPSSSSSSSFSDYKASLLRDRANQQAAAELASLLWVLAHEMSLEDYGTVESEVFTQVFALVHGDREKRMAGLAAVDALLAAPSADEEKKAIKFANTLSTGLRCANGDFEFLSAVSSGLGHMARRTANVDFVESEVTRALEWLRTDRSDRRYVPYCNNYISEEFLYAPFLKHDIVIGWQLAFP
jgi:hypothetical protein